VGECHLSERQTSVWLESARSPLLIVRTDIGSAFRLSYIIWRIFGGWHRLARSGAYLCALAQEAYRDKPRAVKTSFGSAAPVAQSGNRGHPVEVS